MPKTVRIRLGRVLGGRANPLLTLAAGMSKAQIGAVIGKSFAIDTSPYGEVPKAVLALAKK